MNLALTVKDYCAKCNAPHSPPIAVALRCGMCAVKNGVLPPTKFKELKE